MNKSMKLLLSASIIMLPVAGYAAECPDRFQSTSLEYLGRDPGNSKSYWLTLSNRADNFRLSAPGASDIDLWSTTGPSARVSESPVVSSDYNGIHYVDRMTSGGSFDCFLQSRGQSNPLVPPNWRPPKPPVTGVMPQIPIAVKPPVAILPPTGIMPNRPGVITVTPSRPGVVPVTPERPGVVPVMPEKPGVITVTPDVPVQPEQLKPVESAQVVSSEEARVSDPRCAPNADGSLDPSVMGLCSGAPLTPGRDLVKESEWNSWVDTRYGYSRNGRGYFDQTVDSGTISFGADRLIDQNMSVGLMGSTHSSESEKFLDYVKEDAVAIELGPYVTYRLNPEWSLFGSVLLGPRRADHEVVMFEGTSDAMLYSFSTNAQGQYRWGEHTYVRPSVGFSYSYTEIDSYDLSGEFKGKYLNLEQDDVESDSGVMDAAVEFNWVLLPEPDRVFMPFVELGVEHVYLEPENEAVRFSGSSDAPRTLGSVRLGTRMLVDEKSQLDLNLAYRSIGVNNMDDWELQLFYSRAF